MVVQRDSDRCNAYQGGSRLVGVAFVRAGAYGLNYFNASGAAVAYSQLGFDRLAPSPLQSPPDQSHSMWHCSFEGGYHSAVGFYFTGGVAVDGNVVARAVGSGIRIDGNSTAINVTNNLVVNSVAPAFFLDNHPQDTLQHGGIDVRSGVNIVRGNIIGGSERAGFLMVPEPCLITAGVPTRYGDNEAHSVATGLWLLDDAQPPGWWPAPTCAVVSPMVIFAASEYGLYGFIPSSVLASGLVIVDAKVGVHVNVYAPPSLSHVRSDKVVEVAFSLIVGQSNATERAACIGPSVSAPVPLHSWKWAWGGINNLPGGYILSCHKHALNSLGVFVQILVALEF
jgi:hypothetical protein